MGLILEDADMVLAKSANQFREGFESIASEIYVVDTSGISSSNLLKMPFKNLTRPFYPLDEIKGFVPEITATGHEAVMKNIMLMILDSGLKWY